jgi:hypothetical protein
VQEEESSQDVCSGGELLPPLKSKITHAEFYCNGKLMDSYLDSLSGTTYEHSMESLGEGKSMSSQAVFHARTLVPQEKAQDLTESDQDSGEKWQGSFAKYDPVTHSLRTHQCSLFEDSTEYCATLPKWGLMLNGELWEQQTLVQSTRGIESGLSPTPPPPDNWPTPATKGYGHAAEGMVGNLIEKIQQGVITKLEAEQMLSLPHLENHRTWKKKFPTPQASDHRDRGNMSNAVVQRRIAIGKQISLSQSVSLTSGQLNPMWVEWLMGFPRDWTNLSALVMPKSHCVPQQHGKYSVKESND